MTDAQLRDAGLEYDERSSLVYGYRTTRSKYVGATEYEPGKEYTTDVVSLDHHTACHPGIYFAGLTRLREQYTDATFVRVAVLRHDVITAGDKFRTKRLWVLGYVDRDGKRVEE